MFTANIDRLAAIEQDVKAAVAGSRLVHGDLRGDNCLIVGPEQPGDAWRRIAVD